MKKDICDFCKKVEPLRKFYDGYIKKEFRVCRECYPIPINKTKHSRSVGMGIFYT